MNTALHNYLDNSINFEIQSHPTWLGTISGLKAEKMLRGKKPYVYVLRAGENLENNETDYYVSFVLPDLSIRHQPFVITVASEGWYYENAGPGGPYINKSIEHVIHLMMHCEENECKPLINFEQK
jgi:hypothetical protein